MLGKRSLQDEESLSSSYSDGDKDDIFINVTSLFSGWTVDELPAHQEKDPHIGPVLRSKNASDMCPSWTETSHHSPASKSCFAQWKWLRLVNGVLTVCFL